MNDRIKRIRRALDLTQQEFAARIGSVQNTITGYETGRRVPSNQVISLICKEFNVNEAWLRTGEGEMFRSAASNALDALAAERNLSIGMYVFIEKLLNLKPEYQQVFIDVALEVAAALNATDMSPSELAAPSGIINTNLDALLGKHYPTFRGKENKQNESVEALAHEIAAQIVQEKKAADGSSASPGDDGKKRMA